MARAGYVIYKRCVRGDRRKVEASSNLDSSKGGGARDLRFNPWDKFEDVFAAVFTDTRELADGRKVYTAPVYWSEDGEGAGPTTVEVWSPTKSRDSEGRLARVHEVTPFDEDHIPAEADDPFFLLWDDEEGTVWARYATVEQLRSPEWSSRLVDPILASVDRLPLGANIRGWVEMSTGRREHIDGR